MPKGPRGEQRPADLIGCAVHVARIATGEAEDDRMPQSQRTAAASKGGKARAENLTKTRRNEIAKKAANSRWA